MLTNLFLVLLPFCQLGASYYLSVASLLALLMLAQCWRRTIDGLMRAPAVWLGAILIMISPVAYGGTGTDILRTAREAVFLLFLVGAIRGIEASRPQHHELVSDRLLFGLLAAFALLMVYQSFLLGRGMRFGIPANFYIMGTSTIADVNTLRYSAGNLRAAVTYSEPSYLGAVLLALGMAAVPFAGRKRGKLIIGMIIVTGLMSRSLSVLVAGMLILFVPAVIGQARSGKQIKSLGAALLIALPVLLLTKANSLLSRLSDVSSLQTADVSTTSRVLAPLAALPRYLLDHPLGVPDSAVLRTAYAYIPRTLRPPFDRFSLDNAFLNFFFSHGVFGLVLVAIILTASRDLRVRIFLFCCMSFNGSFLRVDLVAIMIFAILMYHHRDRGRSRPMLRTSARRMKVGPPRPAIPAGTFR